VKRSWFNVGEVGLWVRSVLLQIRLLQFAEYLLHVVIKLAITHPTSASSSGLTFQDSFLH
jgi:hypothetical protein